MSSSDTKGPLSGVLAAAVTPMRESGAAVDVSAVPRLVDFYAASGIQGVFAAGTTGEGILLGVPERIALAEAFHAAAAGRLAVAVHVGAQTTADSVALAEHARGLGVDAMAAIGPPYFAWSDDELLAHFSAVAAAAAPVPFYLYEFRDRTGYAIPPRVVRALGERAANLVGLKVSDSTLEEVRPYIETGLDVFVGIEALIPEAVALGAVGTVSGLAAALPGEVARILDGRASGAHAESLRRALAGYPIPAAFKALLVAQEVLTDASVRPPLRALTDAERGGLEAWLAELSAGASAAA